MIDKQAHIDHFISVGIPKFLAKRMAKLATEDCTEESTAEHCISRFARWRSTPEGVDFWLSIHRHFDSN